MNNYDAEKIAIFRYGLLSDVISTNEQEHQSLSEYFKSASEKIYKDPITGKDKTVSMDSLYRWYRYYKEKGFEGLKPQSRKDEGTTRKLDADTQVKIRYYRENYPRIPSTVIYEKLIEDGTITKKDVSLSTITRYSNLVKEELKQTDKKDMRRYEREHINEVWCGDTCYGPKITVNGEKKRIYFIALIDDASRMIVGIGVFYNDNFFNMMSVLKSAVNRCGKPQILNFDNGKSYRNHQMALLAGRLGIRLNYNPPYTPEGKSKIERFWRTMKDKWMCTMHLSDFHDLNSVNRSLQNFITTYNNTVHSSLNGKTPHERFFEESQMIRYLDPEIIDKTFLIEEKRKATIDGVIVIDGVEYEVGYHYSNQRITIRYSPSDSKAYVINPVTDEMEEIHKLDKHSNSKAKRETFRLSESVEE